MARIITTVLSLTSLEAANEVLKWQKNFDMATGLLPNASYFALSTSMEKTYSLPF